MPIGKIDKKWFQSYFKFKRLPLFAAYLGKQWMVIWASGPLRVNCALETSHANGIIGALAGRTNHGLFN